MSIGNVVVDYGTVVRDEKTGDRWSLDHVRGYSGIIGQLRGLDRCEKFLLDRSVLLFMEGKHDEAIALKRLALEMKAKLEEAVRTEMKDHEESFPKLLNNLLPKER